MIDETDKVKAFWNKRAQLKETSGTNDYMLNTLELTDKWIKKSVCY